MTNSNHCPLCLAQSEKIIWQNKYLRIIAVQDNPNMPAYCRVIWNDHTAEMTDLSLLQRQYIMQAVYHTEQALRQIVHADKINLASFGNQVPHVHWHVIARFKNDMWFPDSIWATPQRQQISPRLPENWLEQLTKFIQVAMESVSCH